MKKNEEQNRDRAEFIKLTLNDSKAAARQLKEMATRLERARTTSDRVSIVADLLYVSESTIFRELKRC